MALEFKKNKNTMNGLFIIESVLKDDLETYEDASGITDACIKHIIYYLKGKFSGVVLKQSDTSGGTTVSFVGKYPESRLVELAPVVSIYTDDPITERITMGSIVGSFGGKLVKSNNANYIIFFDIWGRTPQEMNIINGYIKQVLEDAVFDNEFIFTRGFNNVTYIGASNREFDIADNYVNDVSHLDSSIRYRRNQMLYEFEFLYRMILETIPTSLGEIDNSLETISSYEGDLTTNLKIQSTGININVGWWKGI